MRLLDFNYKLLLGTVIMMAFPYDLVPSVLHPLSIYRLVQYSHNILTDFGWDLFYEFSASTTNQPIIHSRQ